MASSPNAEYRAQIADALLPLVDGRRLIATKTYFIYTRDDATVDVGVLSIASTKEARDALAALIRDEQELAAQPHANHHESAVVSFGRNQPTPHKSGIF